MILILLIVLTLISGYLIIFILNLNQKLPTIDFSSITPKPSFDITTTPPHPYRPWKAGPYHMTMGLRKMPAEDWLVLDNQYIPQQIFRRHLLFRERDGVMQVLPDSHTLEACEELLQNVVGFLVRRYPQYFRLERNGDFIYNGLMNERTRVKKPLHAHPLEIAARLVMEDINLLVEDENGEYRLNASFHMAPAGWDIRERIGWPVWRIHGPVPTWSEKLGNPMRRFFSNLKVSSPVQRNAYFIQTDSNLFQQEPFPESLPCPPKVEDIHIRHERQALRRLPRTGAIAFMVRTYMTPLTDLRNEKGNLRELRDAIRAWPENIARYKGKSVWGDVFEQWCGQVLGDEESDDAIGNVAF